MKFTFGFLFFLSYFLNTEDHHSKDVRVNLCHADEISDADN